MKGRRVKTIKSNGLYKPSKIMDQTSTTTPEVANTTQTPVDYCKRCGNTGRVCESSATNIGGFIVDELWIDCDHKPLEDNITQYESDWNARENQRYVNASH